MNVFMIDRRRTAKHANAASHRLTSAEMAVRYGVSHATLRQWMNQDTFPHDESYVVVGVAKLWDPKPVDHWLYARRHARFRPNTWRRRVEELIEHKSAT